MTPRDPERGTELLCDRALVGLDPIEEGELIRLLSAEGLEDDRSLELTAAAIDLAASPPPAEALPPHLERLVLGAAAARFADKRPAPSSKVVPLRPPSRVPAIVPWLAAAACFALLLGGVVLRGLSREPLAFARQDRSSVATARQAAPSAAEGRAALLAAGATLVEWKATDDPAGKAAGGDVVWSTTEQRGYMRFRGLAANDPRVSQYQLWIFDKNQDAKYPVDGGVFDVGANGEVVVPIDAKLRVVDPTLFAITVEKPGGVVVSKRERIVLTASTG
jgi:hypothetical protein